MKKIIFFSLLLLSLSSLKVSAQADEVEQLLLNVEKLAQLKQILHDMKKGYAIVSTGYNTIKTISQGNFNLHKAFLDGLLEVSPTVRKYKRVADIFNYQILLVKEYRYAYHRFQEDGNFNSEEIKYLGRVYANLFDQSLKSINDLITIVTSGELRMTDDERLKAIDDIYFSMLDKFIFLRHFNTNTTLLAVQRAKEKKDVNSAQQVYGLTR